MVPLTKQSQYHYDVCSTMYDICIKTVQIMANANENCGINALLSYYKYLRCKEKFEEISMVLQLTSELKTYDRLIFIGLFHFL